MSLLGVLEHTKHTRCVGIWLILFSGHKDDQAPGGGEAERRIARNGIL